VVEAQWLSQGEQAVWRAYLDVSRLLTERLQRQTLEDSGLSLAEYEILVHLSEAPEHRMRMSELADSVVNSRSRLTHTVGRLESRELVRRQACEEDGRGVVCSLTRQGMGVLESAAPGHVQEVRRSLFDALDHVEVEGLGQMMAKVRAHLRQD
jgi:DNA-binding MarR family transcriptional regulator